MAGASGRNKYLNALKTALLTGKNWNSEELYVDVLGLAHLLRDLKLAPQLARCYLSIIYKDTPDFVILKVEEAPHPRIPKLRRDTEVNHLDLYEKAIILNNSDYSHATLLAVDRIQTVLYLRDACDCLMQEKGWGDIDKLPKLIAAHARRAGLSAHTCDFTVPVLVPKKDQWAEMLLKETANSMPSRPRIQTFLGDWGMPATDDAVSELHTRCESCLSKLIIERGRGTAVQKGGCQNPDCGTC